MNALIINMAGQRSKELRDYASRRRLAGRRRRDRAAGPGAGAADGVSIRRLDRGADGAELARLAGRDSAPTPTGDVLAAERNGRLIAALSLTTGELVADPFTPTAEAGSLLERRAGQLREHRGDPKRPIRRHGFHRPAPARRG